MEDIYLRQSGLIHPDKLRLPILIVGAGSIGSWTALALSKLGCSNITVMDSDNIEPQNAGSQIYRSSDVGGVKVTTLIDKLSMLTDQPVYGRNHHWNIEHKDCIKDLDGFQIIIAAVDNITVRSELFSVLKTKNSLYIDARMAGNAIEIYKVQGNNMDDVKAYEGTLFSEEETIPVNCSERSVVYNVFIVAGLIGDMVAKYVNEQELPREIIMDLFNFTLYK